MLRRREQMIYAVYGYKLSLFLGKAIPKGCRSLRPSGFVSSWHIKVARFSAPHTGRLYSQETPLVIISVKGLVHPRAMV